ncbi:MAG: PAS domain-containing protein [Planctomycetota bacterium]
MTTRDEEGELPEDALGHDARSTLEPRAPGDDLARHTAWLRVTLASIGEAVIGTDEHGHITSMNDVAESLTCWSAAEAQGRPLPEVFHIVNDQSRLPVENPAARVLRDGTVVGPENHSVLIARDGTERPIDESAAAVRSDEGRIVGSLVVFRDSTERHRVRDALRESEAFNSSVLEAMPDCVALLDGSGRLVRINANGLSQLEIDDFAPFRGRALCDLWSGAARSKVLGGVESALAGRIGRLQMLAPVMKGTRKWWDVVVAPIRGAGGEVVCVVAVSRDITELKDAEAGRLASEEFTRNISAHSDRQRRLYESILANTPDLASVFGLDRRFIYANDVFLKFWGKTWGQTIGKTCLELGYEATHAATRDHEIDQVVATGQSIRGEMSLAGTSGGHIHEYILVPVLGQRGKVEAVAVTTRDITDRRRTEGLQLANEQRLRLAAEAAELGIWVWDVANDRVGWENSRSREILGLPPEQETFSAARFKSEFLHPEDVDTFERAVSESARLLDRFNFVGRIRRSDGETRWVEFTGRPLAIAEGGVLQMHGTVADITEKKVVEERLRHAAELNAKIRTMFDQGTQFAGMLSLDGTVIEINRLALDACGFKREEVIGKPFWECGWWSGSKSLMELVRQAIVAAAAGHSFRTETHSFVADGSERFVDLCIAPVLSDEGHVLFVSPTWSDITERRLAELQVRESEDRFRTLADNMSQFAWMADERGSKYWFNKRWLEYTGTTQRDVQGWAWTRVYHPEHIGRMVEGYCRALESGEAWEDTIPIRGRNGGYRWFLTRAVPIRDKGGAILRWLGTSTDIHEQREAEQALMQGKGELERRVEERTQELLRAHEQLRRTERMASMGTLSAGLGHDMSNLLLPLRLRLDGLEEAALSEQAREDVLAIRTSADYLQKLANGLRLLALNPDASAKGEASDLRSWWDDANSVMRSVLPRGILLEADFPGAGCLVAISRSALTQVVFNLVQNAGDAMRARGSGRVTVRGWAEAGAVCVSVGDNGPGMTEEVKARCMEPFFTTKERGMSTGLGLALVYGHVQESRGTIEVWSELGQGTVFTLKLPLAGGVA